MKNRLVIGDKRVFAHVVSSVDIAAFDSGVVHHVCSTFALAKYIEWTSRLFIIEIMALTEEGIGTMLHIDHVSPAFVGDKLVFEATITSINKNELFCNVVIHVKNRIIATSKTGQKLILKHRLNEIFSSLATNGKNE